MLEYRNGEFSENMDIESALAKFQNALTEDPFTLKALHVGTEEELNEIRLRKAYHPESDKGDLQAQIDDLKETLEAMKPVSSPYIHILSEQEREVAKGLLESNEQFKMKFPV